MEELRKLYIEKSHIPQAYLNKKQLILTHRQDEQTFKELKQIEEKVTTFIKQHHNLYITSAIVGNGKTTWATRIGLAYIEKFACNYAWPQANNAPVIFINVPEFLSMKKLSISQPYLKEEVDQIEQALVHSQVAIFDDIATKAASEYDKELLYTWINYRDSHQLSSIYTSNVTGNALESLLGPRLYSRIINNSFVFEIVGKDMRGFK